MKILNRRARRDYQLLEKYEAGMALTGPEVKSIRAGRLQLEQAFVKIRGGQVFLVNAHVAPYPFAEQNDYDPRRERKLLLSKKEILALEQKVKQKKLTLVPLACYTRGQFIKLAIALGRGQKQYQKREEKRKQDIAKEVARELARRKA